ncbi:DsbA family protein [Amycolatopsis pittospori]|uniref:DsbA family protein n=1 Tax=Amycolatopsis pittospori TaxID=2749434 RepID=UPI0015F04B78|nr:thioredoxin domain-containing protein [Amycolatopsis pittospori]
MGGAERNARKRKQQQTASRSVAQARGTAGGDKKKVIAISVAVAVLAVLVIGGVIWTTSSKDSTEGKVIQAQTGTSAPGVVEKRDGAAVTVGKPEAKKTIDIYADFLCPVCKQFEESFKADIQEQVNNGTLQVRYHMLPMLNQRSDPPGYSLDSANASLAAADAGKFLAFHDALFKDQPQEGARGFDKGQLIKLGQDVGITDPAFAMAINGGAYEQQIQDAYKKISTDPALQQDFGNGPGFGTPTVTANGQVVKLEEGWVQKAVG